MVDERRSGRTGRQRLRPWHRRFFSQVGYLFLTLAVLVGALHRADRGWWAGETLGWLVWTGMKGRAGRRQWQSHHRSRRRRCGLCQWCGYDLRGNRSGTCPECGQASALRFHVEGAIR